MQVSKHVPAMIPLIAVLSISAAQAQTTIGHLSNGAPTTSFVSSFGPYLGQVFTTPADNVLNSFTVQMGQDDTSIDFSVYAFNTTSEQIVGSDLFSGNLTSSTVIQTTAPNIIYNEYTFTPDGGGLSLITGDTYIALIKNTLPGQVASAPLFLNGNNYVADYCPGGYAVAGGYAPAFPTHGPVADFMPITPPTGDLAFNATFTPAPAVPEASTTVSFGLLLALGAGVVTFKRKRRA